MNQARSIEKHRPPGFHLSKAKVEDGGKVNNTENGPPQIPQKKNAHNGG